MVYDDEHIGLWERGSGSSAEAMQDGSKLMIYFRKPSLREEGVLPRGGIARFYGTAKIYKSGPVYDEVWRRLVQPEKDRDPDKKGYAVLIAVERAEDLAGAAAEPRLSLSLRGGRSRKRAVGEGVRLQTLSRLG